MNELTRAALVGLANSAPPASGSGLERLLPPSSSERRLLRQAGLIALARKAGRLSDAPAPLPPPAPDESGAPMPPSLAGFVGMLLAPGARFGELADEILSTLAARALRLPPALIAPLLAHPLASHPAVPALVGARGAWLLRLAEAGRSPFADRPKPRYRHAREALMLAEIRRRFHEELARVP